MSTRPHLPARSICALSVLFACALTSASCADKVKLERSGHEQSGQTVRAEPPETPSCEGRDDGELCAADRHCVAGACVFNTCGDGIRAGDEECDDGNEVLGDDCNPACKFTPVSCGNAKKEAGEECDDGNQNDEDACSNGCTLSVCGNGRRDPKEECDDGNQENMDYCANNCARSLCRNGRLDPGEACDDGNAVHGDGCTNDCRMLGCGDGKLYTMAGPLLEECDDGNKTDTDGCSNRCTVNRCGNERVDPGELCDGNTSDMGKCNADCKSWGKDECAECMAMNCREYNGFDVYGPCYETIGKENPITATPTKTSFVPQCTEFDRCVRLNRCYDPMNVLGTAPCVCGSLSYAECDSLGPVLPAGPCVEQAILAANCETNRTTTCLLAQLQDFSYPSGFAFFLGECRNMRCADKCK